MKTPHWSTGVSPKNFRNLVGERFGRLVVESRAANGPKGMACWLCRCDCGGEKVIRGSHLLQGRIESCGCLRRETTIARKTIHGRSRTTEHVIWMGMIDRCTNQNSEVFPRYGGRGIHVCKRWLGEFQAFLDDMGARPSADLTLDRIDNDGGYTCGKCDDCRERGQPANCRWATRMEQGRNKRSNRRIAHDGETLTLTEWAQRTGLKREAIAQRLNAGWSVERALTTPT